MDILSRPVPRPDHRIFYGPDPNQFGDLWVPRGSGTTRWPLVVFYHGGWWKSEYDLGYAGHLCSALKTAGIACWSIEYRRVGSSGGGWPHTFQDAAAGFDFIATLATTYPLDLTRVIVSGHSAGGHLAFWIAGRHHLDPASGLERQTPQVPLLACVALAGAVDLRLIIDLAQGVFAHDRYEVAALMGGLPADQPLRYKQGNPGDLLPFNIPQVVVQGDHDDQIPPQLPSRWSHLATRAGDKAQIHILSGADHFDVVDPMSHAWPFIQDIFTRALKPQPK